MPKNYDKALGLNRKCNNEECDNILDRYQKNYCCHSCNGSNVSKTMLRRWSNPEKIRVLSESFKVNNPMFNPEVRANHPTLKPWSDDKKEKYSKFRKDHPEFHEARLKAAHSPEVRKRATDTILKNNPNHFLKMSQSNNGGGFRSSIRARYRLDGMTLAEHLLWNYRGFKELGFIPFQTLRLTERWIYPDFLNETKKVVVEIDGSWHNQSEIREDDKLKEAILKSNGYTIIRFSNRRVFEDLDQIIEELRVWNDPIVLTEDPMIVE